MEKDWKDQLRALATNGGKGSIQPINKRMRQQIETKLLITKSIRTQ